MIKKVVHMDIPTIKGFSIESLNKMDRLIATFSSIDKISYDRISRDLGLSKPLIGQALEALEKADITQRVYPCGSNSTRLRKTPKYKFLAPCVKAAFLSTMGSNLDSREILGQLLEDTYLMYMLILKSKGVISDFCHLPRKGSADLSITARDGSRIIVEIGYGRKGSSQIISTMESHSAKYGVVISNRELELEENRNILFIPRELALMI
jgi:hypothetical protein